MDVRPALAFTDELTEEVGDIVLNRFKERDNEGKMSMPFITSKIVEDLAEIGLQMNERDVLNAIYASVYDVSKENQTLVEGINFIKRVLSNNPGNKIVFFTEGDPMLQKLKADWISYLLREQGVDTGKILATVTDDIDKRQRLGPMIDKYRKFGQVMVVDNKREVIDEANRLGAWTWWRNPESELGNLDRCDVGAGRVAVLLDIDGTIYPGGNERYPAITKRIVELI